MARIPTYQKDVYISDLDRIIGTDGDTNELVTKNFFLGDIAEYVIDKFIDPDAVSFTIPVLRDTQDTVGANATRITGSIMSQDTNPDGTKITIAGLLQVDKEANIKGKLTGGVAEPGQLVLNSSLNATGITIKAPLHADLPASYTMELPNDIGTAGSQLTTDGVGKVYWADPEDDNLTFSGDAGQGTVDLDTQILNIVGGNYISTTALNQTLTINIDGVVTGSGTTGTLPMWGSTGEDLVDSLVSQGGSTVYIDGNVTVTGNSTLNGNVTLSNNSGDLITQNGTLYLNGPVKDTTNTFGTADQILVSDASGELIFTDSTNIAVGSAEVIEVPVKNLQGSALTKGDPVYISGSVGTSGRLEVQLADASNAAKMPAVGLLKQDLGVNEEGFVVVTGKLRNLDNGAIDGQTPSPNDVVYVKASGTTGNALTLVKPVGSALIQNMGKVGRVSNVGSNDGTFVVSSILRTNDIPNLTPGKIWVGSTGNTIESTVVSINEANDKVTIAGTIDLSDSYNSTIIGTLAGGNGRTSITAVGYNALQNNTGDYSNGFGSYALQNNTGLSSNGFGYNALQSNTAGTSNAFGSSALQNNTGLRSNAFGHYALQDNTGDYSNGFGYNALQNNSGSNNTAFGHIAGYESLYLTGSNNTFLGAYASYGTNTTISNSTAVGANVILTDSNTVILGNGANVGIGTTSPSQKLDVDGHIKMTETGATSDTDKFVVLDSGVLKYRTGAQVLSDISNSILSQDTNPAGRGLVLDGDRIKVDGTAGVKDSLTINYDDGTNPRVFPQQGENFTTRPTGRIGVVNNDGALEWAFTAVSKGDPDSKRSGLLHSESNAYRLILTNATEESVYLNSEGDSFIKGKLGIGKDAPNYKLDVDGSVAVSGDIYTNRVRRANGATELRINQARFFDTGNIANKYGTDIGATLHLRTDSSAEDKDVIALTKEGEGTSVTSGIKQSTAGEYTLILRDASNNQRVNFTTIELGQSFIDNTRVILSGNTNNANGAITINGRKWSSGERNAFMKFNKSGTQLDTALEFYSGGVLKGSIAYDSTGTAYNVSSDYRLKENVVEITDGIERLKQLKPSRFNFISDADKVVDGFIAHEVQDIIPEAVTGEKDATEEYEVTPAEYDDYGNVVSEAVMGTRDAYQQIDQAKIVPLLTAALQEAVAKIESLEARIQTLEGN